jgi:hypothetical protein
MIYVSERGVSRLTNRWVVLFTMVSLLLLVSCSTVSNQVDRYEENYNQEYGAAIQDQNNPGLIHYEDEYVLMNLMLLPKADMAFQIMNKTGGTITIVWANVMYDVPRTGLVQAVPSGSLTSVIPSRKGIQNKFSPYQPLSLFPEDYEVSGRSANGTQFAYQQFTVRMPIRMDATGETMLYLFVYTYHPEQGIFSGACNRVGG